MAVHQHAPLRRAAGAGWRRRRWLLLAAALSLYLALALAAFAALAPRPAPADAPLFAALWLLAELARGVLFTGFPWLAAGYAQVDAPLAALAPWVGVYGIGAVLACAGAALALLAAQRAAARWRPAAAALALVGAGRWPAPREFTPAGRRRCR
ncbi:MAG: hypothetical protein MZW92_36660 [Comamonadaceae bacterium]|nr:hypothetical protein [Comamonadaceae bacterium]